MTDNTARLHVDELLAAATSKVGLSDFGDTWFLEPLGVLVSSLNSEAGLDQAGVDMTRHRLLSLLVDRLRLRSFQAENPGVRSVPVQVAAVICGMPRTGSTLLQRLLASSPQATSTFAWETTYPLPFPGEGPGAPVRRRRARERMEAAAASAPEFSSIHPSRWDAVDEDVVLIDRSFVSMSFESFYWVPTYGDWLRAADHSHAYGELREWLQVLSWGDEERQGRQWVLKSPHHLLAVDTVLDTFEDCTMVMTHRSPVSTVPSYASMVAALTSLYNDRIDHRLLGPYWSSRFATSLHQLEGARAPRPHRFLDVRYDDLVTDPTAATLAALDALGMPVGVMDRALIDEAVVSQQGSHRGGHTYLPEDFGLHQPNIEQDFAFYSEVYL